MHPIMKILLLFLPVIVYGRAQISSTTNWPKIPPSPFGCAYANNSLGDCGCNGQIFIADQCHLGFICLGGGDDPFITTATGVWQGCQLECREDEVLRADPNNGGRWDCFRTSEGSRPLQCAGKFRTECGCLPDIPEDLEEEPEECQIGECACDNQIWMAYHCHEAKVCHEGGSSMVDCRGTTNAYGVATPFVNVNLLTHTWSCVETNELCLGSFHVGCQDDSVTTTTTTTTTAKTTNATTNTPTTTSMDSDSGIEININLNIDIDIDLTINMDNEN